MSAELPEWVKVGARCPLIGDRGTIVGHATIEKVNKRFIVAGGANYSIPRDSGTDKLDRAGDARWGNPRLYDPGCPKVAVARRKTTVANVAAKIRGHAEALDRAARNSQVDVWAVRDVIAAIEAELGRLPSPDGVSPEGVEKAAVEEALDLVVTTGDIARRIGVAPSTPAMWAQRHAGFPEPIGRVGKADVWYWPEVHAWLKSTGKIER